MDIREILSGNDSFIEKADAAVLRDLAEHGQHPVATVISCSDSRVPVEVVFDRLSTGALFVIRVAGNVVADSSVVGSIEYAVEHLHTPHLIVLAHTGCGAVGAALQGGHGGELGKLLGHIRLESREVADAVLENLSNQVENVLAVSSVKGAVSGGSVEVWGMLYDLPTGKVSVLTRNGQPYPVS